MDAFSAVCHAFEEELRYYPDLFKDLDNGNPEDALELGRDAARAVIGPLLMRQLLGDDRLDTGDAATLLGVTRQALHKRARTGGILAVPGRGTTWYPAWQFDFNGHAVRPTLSYVLRDWVRILGDHYDPETFLAWSVSEQPDLESMSPREWITEGRDPDQVAAVARRTARQLVA